MSKKKSLTERNKEQEKPTASVLTESLDGLASAFSQLWPYVCFRDIKQGQLWLINLNLPDKINIISLPETIIEIVATEITESYELFIVCETYLKEKKFMSVNGISSSRDTVGYKIFRCDLH